MKISEKIKCLFLIGLTMLAASCSKDDTVSTENGDGTGILELSISTQKDSSRSFTDATGMGTVKELRLIVFKSENGNWVYENAVLLDDFSATDNPYKMTLSTGKKRIYIFANANMAQLCYFDNTLSQWKDFNFATTNESDLQNVAFKNFKMDASANPSNDLTPMTAVIEPYITKGEELTFKAQLKRAIAKININIKKDASITKDVYFEELTISDIPAYTYLLPRLDNQSHIELPFSSSAYNLYNGTTTLSPQQRIMLTSDYVFAGSRYCQENPYGKAANNSVTPETDTPPAKATPVILAN